MSKEIFTQEHVHSLRRDELLEIVEAMEARRREDLAEVAKNVGYNDPRATRVAGGVDLLDGFISEIRRELDRRNQRREGEVNDGTV